MFEAIGDLSRAIRDGSACSRNEDLLRIKPAVFEPEKITGEVCGEVIRRTFNTARGAGLLMGWS